MIKSNTSNNSNIVINDGNFGIVENTLISDLENNYISNNNIEEEEDEKIINQQQPQLQQQHGKSEIFHDLLSNLSKLDQVQKEMNKIKILSKIEIENKIFNNGFKANSKYDQVNCKVVKEIDTFRINEEIELLPSSYAFKKYIKLKLNSLLHCSKSQSEDFQQTFERIFDTNSNWSGSNLLDLESSADQLQQITTGGSNGGNNNCSTMDFNDTQSISTSISTSSTISSIVHCYDYNTTNIVEEIRKRKKKKVQIQIEKMIFVRRNGSYYLMYGSYKRTKSLTLISFFPFNRHRLNKDSLLSNYLYHGRNLINEEFVILTNIIQIKYNNILINNNNGGTSNGGNNDTQLQQQLQLQINQ